MTLCYVVPGFLSSDLLGVQYANQSIWMNYAIILTGQLGKLRLAANGRDPGPPDGQVLLAGAPLASYWPPLLAQLGAQLPGTYQVIPWGYDWRKELYGAGKLLADSVVNHVTAADPCTIVAHSTGGLVARAAWTELVLAGKSDLCRRIVTLATPHQGTYAAAVLLSGAGPFVHDALVVNYNGLAVDFNAVPPNEYLQMTQNFLAELGGTWPATYELLPVRGSPDSSGDPNRDFLFNATHWNGRPGVSQDWLDYANGPWQAWQLGANSTPPENVLTTVAGGGLLTWSTLNDSALLGQDGFASSSWDGDGIVTTDSALVAGSVRYQVIASHNALPSSVLNSGQLVAWILEPRSAPVPPPPVSVISGVNSLQNSSVVLWSPGSVLNQALVCVTGKCDC